jgi:hypothetical protein
MYIDHIWIPKKFPILELISSNNNDNDNINSGKLILFIQKIRYL